MDGEDALVFRPISLIDVVVDTFFDEEHALLFAQLPPTHRCFFSLARGVTGAPLK